MKRQQYAKKRKRGRPLGSKSKFTVITPIKIVILKCIKCKRRFRIRTDNPEIYTDEIKREWVCPICTTPKYKGK